ncbi:phosphoribosylanthranilate isomerase [Thermophagus sp. OGC60D27]|uniref:phosphoribosylanthranilate isomerase n=1 Tax=Thermophagus sp. OGC60D27 TaxID=3458415 RepID=UPI0040376A58
MRDQRNIEALIALKPDYIGFIFYPQSPRYAGNILNSSTVKGIPSTIKKTGVFVNADTHSIVSTCQKYHLNSVQLHGKETPLQCRELQKEGLEIIKAFSLKQTSDLKITDDYHDSCHYFLFDTPSAKHGGSGQKFDWSVLSQFNADKPFFLSGGIGESDAKAIIQHCPVQPYAVDINSRFETAPGMKNIEAIARFLSAIKQL